MHDERLVSVLTCERADRPDVVGVDDSHVSVAFGLDTRTQPDELPRSMSVFCVPLVVSRYCPTAHATLSEAAATPSRWSPPVPTVTDVWIAHAPFTALSANVR